MRTRVEPAVTARALRSAQSLSGRVVATLLLAAGAFGVAMFVGSAPVVIGAAPGQATASPAPVATPVVFDVIFRTDGLNPASIAVPAGSTVRWTNDTDVIHNTTHVPDLAQPALWSSGDLAPGAAFSVTFQAAGTYPYIDNRFPDDLDFQGRVVVTRNDPTATPLTPTPGPSPTSAPTFTPREPTPTVPPTPTRLPTQVPVVLLGRLDSHTDTRCDLSAQLRPCDDPTRRIPVRYDFPDAALFGRDVRLEGVWDTCAATGERFVWLSQVSVLPGGCGGPTATPSPSPTPTVRAPFSPADNLALGRSVTAKRPELPGYEPAKVTDGDPGTMWYSPDQASWIYVDLGEKSVGQPWTFNQIRLRWAYPFAEQYGIYIWDDNAWRGVFLADNNRGGEDVRNLAFTESRYVLLYLMRSSLDSGGFALSEIEVYGDDRPNWAKGQPVVVSSETAGREGMFATDGLQGTWWASRVGDANPWIGVYLPSSIALIDFKLLWTTDCPQVYSLVFFERGQYTFSAPVRSNGCGLHHFGGSVPVRADTIMVYTHVNSPRGQIGLQEIELYSPGPGVVVAASGAGWLRSARVEGVRLLGLDAFTPGGLPPLRVAPR
jgi:plastocyanin